MIWTALFLGLLCPVPLWELRDSSANAAVFSPDGKLVAFYGVGRDIALWDTITWKQVGKLERHLGHVTNVVFSRDSKTLFAGSHFSINGPNILMYLRENQEPPDCISEIVAWDVAACVQRWRQERIQSNGICLALSPDGTLLASTCGLNSEYIRLSNSADGKDLYTFATYANSDTVRSLAFSPDGRRLAAGSLSGVRLLDLAGRSELTYLPGYIEYFHQVTYSSGGGAILSVDTPARGSTVAELRLHDAGTGQLRTKLRGTPKGPLAAIPGRDVFAAAVPQGGVWFLDATTGKVVAAIRAHAMWTLSLAFSPDGKHMVTLGAGRDVQGRPYGEFKLWDITQFLPPGKQ